MSSQLPFSLSMSIPSVGRLCNSICRPGLDKSEGHQEPPRFAWFRVRPSQGVDGVRRCGCLDPVRLTPLKPLVIPTLAWQSLIREFVDNALGGSLTPFIAYMTQSEPLSEDELQALKEMLDEQLPPSEEKTS